ncbi:MAG: DNA-processing protein DprA [Paludibacteraceae bacterium]|nr:DNA-processing protein DprA [Paludibacteraceae bacterium]
MEDSSLKYKIWLTLVKGVGPLMSKKLLSVMDDEEAIYKASPKVLAAIPGIGPVLSSALLRSKDLLPRAEQEVEFAKRNGISILYYKDKGYPSRLLDCPDAPTVLYVKGSPNFNAKKVLGVVGTRKMTEYGRSLCESIIHGLSVSHPDLMVVSGLAYGVDVCAHRKSLERGVPTVGVVGHSLEHIYPAAHRQTALQMMNEGGALVSEYVSGTYIDRNFFVARNRIIAGMCDCVLVVESGEKGGSLLTAEFANSYHRDVFACPGRVGDPYSSGCNRLIMQNKAALVTSSADIDYMMNWEEKSGEATQLSLFPELEGDQASVVEILKGGEAYQMNEISRMVHLPINKISSLMFELEFAGVVVSVPGNRYKLAR